MVWGAGGGGGINEKYIDKKYIYRRPDLVEPCVRIVPAKLENLPVLLHFKKSLAEKHMTLKTGPLGQKDTTKES